MIEFPENPYNILGVDRSASKGDIVKSVPLAMKQKRYPIKVIASTQKILLDPEKRLIADYLYPVLLPVESFKTEDFTALSSPKIELKLLDDFDLGFNSLGDNVSQEILSLYENVMDDCLVDYTKKIESSSKVAGELENFKPPSAQELSPENVYKSVLELKTKDTNSKINKFDINPDKYWLDVIRIFLILYIVFSIFF